MAALLLSGGGASAAEHVAAPVPARALLEFPLCPSGTTLDRAPATTASNAPAPATR